jgi:hypothetical protein
MIDREELAARVFVALYTREPHKGGAYVPPHTGELAAEAIAVAQTMASAACVHFGHVYGGEGCLHEHECARCGGSLAVLVNADRAAFEAANHPRGSSFRPGAGFQPRRVYIGDCE